MTDDELVKKVARVMCETENGPCGCIPNECECTYWQASARAAIAVMRPIIRLEVLEEAARVADWPYPASDGWNEEQAGRIAAAADIRAMFPKEEA